MIGTHRSPSAGKRIFFLTLFFAFIFIQNTLSQETKSGQDGNNFQVRLEPIKIPKEFAKATVPGALQYACSPKTEELRAFFEFNRTPFDPKLVHRNTQTTYCHIFYRPTVPGFRAHSEADPVQGVVFGVESRSYLAQRNRKVGDSLDIAKAMAHLTPTALEMVLNTRVDVSEHWLYEAERHHFEASEHAVETVPNPAARENFWAQDYVKSGAITGESVVLLPRMAYEGSPENGAVFEPLLDTLQQTHWVRSKLSWDGGDLLVSRDPHNPNRHVLFYGDAARPYWAKSLNDSEYAHVLKIEFGADSAVDVGGIATHADYALNFLPDSATALVSRPVYESYPLSNYALQVLLEIHGNVPALLEIAAFYGEGALPKIEDRRQLMDLIKKALDDSVEWPRMMDVVVIRRAQLYADKYCDGDLPRCLMSNHLEELMERDPELARAWVEVASDLKAQERSSSAMLGLLASQLAEPDRKVDRRVEELINDLQGLGFHVVEVPRIGGLSGTLTKWAGISYTNFVTIHQSVFMPVFGLGPFEREVIAGIQDRLPKPYRVIPIYAREALASNGGIHCVTGLLRSNQPDIAPASNGAPSEDTESLPVDTGAWSAW